jgi:hypothetical protein
METPYIAADFKIKSVKNFFNKKILGLGFRRPARYFM